MGIRLRTASSLLAVVALATVSACGSAAPPAARAAPTATAASVVPPSLAPSRTPSASPSRRAIPVKVAIFGDSQASALFDTRPTSVSKQLKLSDESISACGIMRGQVRSRTGERFDLIGACPNWLPVWRADAARVKPAIALVVLGAWDVFDVRTKTGTLVYGTPAWDAAFLKQLRDGVAALRASGAQVALAEVPCYRPRPTNPRPPGYWPERGEDTRTRHVNDLLRGVADGRHVFTVTPPSSFCANPKIGDNRAYRYDGVHYLQPGAKLWFDAVIPQLITLPDGR